MKEKIEQYLIDAGLMQPLTRTIKSEDSERAKYIIDKVKEANGYLDPVSKYWLIENGASEFSKEQLEAFDKKPTIASSIKQLFDNKWIRVFLKDDWYTMTRSGHGVAILPYRPKSKYKDWDWEVLIRYEHCPPHTDGQREGKFSATAVTGMIEEGHTVVDTAVKELFEETGYKVDKGNLEYLGWVYPTKATDDKLHLFAIDLDGVPEPTDSLIGDGTKGEEGAYTRWVSVKEATRLPNMYIGACLAKMKRKIS